MGIRVHPAFVAPLAFCWRGGGRGVVLRVELEGHYYCSKGRFKTCTDRRSWTVQPGIVVRVLSLSRSPVLRVAAGLQTLIFLPRRTEQATLHTWSDCAIYIFLPSLSFYFIFSQNSPNKYCEISRAGKRLELTFGGRSCVLP